MFQIFTAKDERRERTSKIILLTRASAAGMEPSVSFVGSRGSDNLYARKDKTLLPLSAIEAFEYRELDVEISYDVTVDTAGGATRRNLCCPSGARLWKQAKAYELAKDGRHLGGR
jgi:hypothetical protein